MGLSQGKLRWPGTTRRYEGSGTQHVLQAPRGPRLHCWGDTQGQRPAPPSQAGRSGVMSYLHASPAPASWPVVLERHVALGPAQRAADAERRHQLHCHRAQPAAGMAGVSASCLPSPAPTPAGWMAPDCPGHLQTAEPSGLGCPGLRHLGTMQREHPACPRSPQLHSPVVVEVEDKVGPWGGRKMGVRAVWSHELAFTLPQVCAVVWGCAGQPAGPGHHCIPLPSTCMPLACPRATPGPENVRHAPHIPA